MMNRILITGAFGLAAMLVGTDADVSLSTNRVEACGIKIAVKAPPARHLRKRAQNAKRAPIKRGGTRVAVKKRVDSKNSRTPIATGPTRQARPVKRTARPQPKRLVVKKAPEPKPEPEVKPEPKPEPKIAKVEPKPEPEVKPEPEPEPEPEPQPDVTPADALNVEVFYETGEFAVSSDGEAALQEVVTWLQANPNGKLIIEGHTDPVGSTARNKALSVKRAKAVRAFLTSAASVPNSRFTVKGAGESKLHYPRNSPKNRRVVVRSR